MADDMNMNIGMNTNMNTDMNTNTDTNLSAKLDTLIRLETKTLLHARIRSGLMGAGVLLLLIVSIVLFVKAHEVSRTLTDVRSLVSVIHEKTDALKVDELNNTITALKSAADNMAGFNMDDFNEGVRLFDDAVETFKALDITNINGLVDSLKTVSERLESATAVFGSIFGRN